MNLPPQCIRCDSTPTIRSHLIPQTFARDVRAGDNDMAVTKGSSERFRVRKNGDVERHILCASCDNLLSADENYASKFLKSTFQDSVGVVPGSTFQVEVDGDRLIRFVAGICWKFSACQAHLGQISLGPYQQLLMDVAFDQVAVPENVNLFLMRYWGEGNEQYFYRNPIPDRFANMNMVRLSLGGFLFHLKTDQNRGPKGSFSELWVRGKSSINVPVAPFERFEEARILQRLLSPHTNLARFLKATASKR